MAFVLQQHESSLNIISDTPASLSTDVNVAADVHQAYSSLQMSAENSPFLGSAGTGGTGEDEEDDEGADQVIS